MNSAVWERDFFADWEFVGKASESAFLDRAEESARNALVALSSFLLSPGARGRVWFVYRGTNRAAAAGFTQSAVPPPPRCSNLFASDSLGSRKGPLFLSLCALCVSGGKFFLFCKNKPSFFSAHEPPLDPKQAPLKCSVLCSLRTVSFSLRFSPRMNQCCISCFGYILIPSRRVHVACQCVVCVRARVRGCGGVM